MLVEGRHVSTRSSRKMITGLINLKGQADEADNVAEGCVEWEREIEARCRLETHERSVRVTLASLATPFAPVD